MGTDSKITQINLENRIFINLRSYASLFLNGVSNVWLAIEVDRRVELLVHNLKKYNKNKLKNILLINQNRKVKKHINNYHTHKKSPVHFGILEKKTQNILIITCLLGSPVVNLSKTVLVT